MSKKNRIRLMAYTPLQSGGIYETTEPQAHYLKDVMRLKVGDDVFLFDGINGEFSANIAQINKKSVILNINQKVADFQKSPDVWLLFAPLKKDNTDIVIQKSVELGVSKIIPVQTEYTSNAGIKLERMRAQVIEAAEQSRRTDLPEILSPITLEKLLEKWDKKRTLVYLNETGAGQSFIDASKKMSAPVAFLVGPEGGFSLEEFEMLKSLPYTLSLALGPRILRAETACLAALSCWQAFCGDWK